MSTGRKGPRPFSGESIAKQKRASVQREGQLQKACVSWFRLHHGRQYAKLLFAIPNGSFLQGNELERIRRAAVLKSQGMEPGVADLFLSVPSDQQHGLYLEAKVGKNKQTDAQKAFEQSVTNQGYAYEVFTSFEQFKEIVTNHLTRAQ